MTYSGSRPRETQRLGPQAALSAAAIPQTPLWARGVEAGIGSHGKAESDRARKILPAGALLVEWEPDHDRGEEKATVMWLVLSPDKWNKDSHLAWRWHPAELQKVQEQDARKRART